MTEKEAQTKLSKEELKVIRWKFLILHLPFLKMLKKSGITPERIVEIKTITEKYKNRELPTTPPPTKWNNNQKNEYIIISKRG